MSTQENPYIPEDYKAKLDTLNLLSVDWIADKEEFDEVVGWFEWAQQGYSIKHIAKELAYGQRGVVEERLERLYFAAVPLFLEAVRIARMNLPNETS